MNAYLDKTLPTCGNSKELGQRLQETPQDHAVWILHLAPGML